MRGQANAPTYRAAVRTLHRERRKRRGVRHQESGSVKWRPRKRHSVGFVAKLREIRNFQQAIAPPEDGNCVSQHDHLKVVPELLALLDIEAPAAAPRAWADGGEHAASAAVVAMATDDAASSRHDRNEWSLQKLATVEGQRGMGKRGGRGNVCVWHECARATNPGLHMKLPVRRSWADPY